MERSNLGLVVDNTDDANDIGRQLILFVRYLLVRQGLGRNTIDCYRRIVGKALRDIGTSRPSHGHVEDFIAEMYQAKKSSTYIANASVCLERYMAFLGNPITLGRPRKGKRLVKDTLSEAEVVLLLAATKNLREKAILAVVACSGIRNAELCSLRVQDVDFGETALRVICGKGAKDRMVYVDGQCIKLIMEYLAKYPRGQEEYLFTTLRHGNKFPEGDLRRLVRKTAVRAGLGKRVFPHLLRHSYATNALDRGANLYTIKDQLGHEFISTTEIYVRSRKKRIRSEVDRFGPSYL